jgi:hypothetical protein
MTENVFYVYEHWRPDKDVCFYVGKGRNLRAWKMQSRNWHHSAVCKKMKRLGLTIDVRIVVTDLSEDTAWLVECERIDFYGLENLTNKTRGGPGIPNPKADVRRKIGIAHRGNKYMVGRKHSAETRRKISERHKGKKADPAVVEMLRRINTGNKYNLGKTIPPEVRAKMSRSHMGRPHRSGRHVWTDEDRAAASARNRGKKMSPEAIEKTAAASRRPVRCITDGMTFISAIAAGKYYGLFNHAKVAEVCRGVRKTAAGRLFEYIDITQRNEAA